MEFSIVTSIFNDGSLAQEFCQEVSSVVACYLNVSIPDLKNKLEIIFVNDGSRDNSLQDLLKVKETFETVKVVDLSRNFGQHEALACGFRLAKGDLIIRLNVDLQDPPNEIPKLLEEIKTKNSDLVVGFYDQRNSPWLDCITAKIYFQVFSFLSGIKIDKQTSAMRVMSRRFIDAYNSLTEKSRFPQGLDHWLGFNHSYVPVIHRSRKMGKSSYNFLSRISLAVTGILYFSDRPLKLIIYLGFCLAGLGTVLGLAIIAQKFFYNSIIPGYTSLAIIGLFGTGLQICCIGVIGIYLGKVFRETQNRPLYVISSIY